MSNSLRYVIYARKSTEDSEKQIQSINDQIDICKKIARELKLNVVEIFQEDKSAKEPYIRGAFYKMIDFIKAGKADAILCWHINRLTRNPVDSGTLQWMLEKEKIKEIRTPERVSKPEDNSLLFAVEGGVARQFIRDHTKAVIRGMDKRLSEGFFQGKAPQGYLNTPLLLQGSREILVDEERFPLIKKAWKAMITGCYTVPQIHAMLIEWNFTTRKHKKIGGTILTLTGLYKIFTNIFYTGDFSFKGKLYKGSYKPMITLEEFDRVQELLGRKGKARPKQHLSEYTTFIKCATCGCQVTADHKKKLIKRGNTYKEYVYYYCTRKNKNIKCTEKRITKEIMEEQLIAQLDSITIIPEFEEWAIDCLKEMNSGEIEERSQIYENLHINLVQEQTRLDNLFKMRLDREISSEKYEQEKIELENKIARYSKQIKETEDRAKQWLVDAERTFKYVSSAREAFINGGYQERREIAMSLGSNFLLHDGKLRYEANEWFEPIKKNYQALEAEFHRLELNKSVVVTRKKGDLTPLIQLWQSQGESNPCFRDENPVS